MNSDGLINHMIENAITIATAESCTGGMLSSYITSYDGVSKIFKGGAITYSNEAKINFVNVSNDTLEKFGPVSSQVCEEMAYGVKQLFETDIGISITGLAGPGGGSKDKPIGLVYIGISIKDKVLSYKIKLDGDRQKIRKDACLKVFDILNDLIL